MRHPSPPQTGHPTGSARHAQSQAHVQCAHVRAHTHMRVPYCTHTHRTCNQRLGCPHAPTLLLHLHLRPRASGTPIPPPSTHAHAHAHAHARTHANAHAHARSRSVNTHACTRVRVAGRHALTKRQATHTRTCTALSHARARTHAHPGRRRPLHIMTTQRPPDARPALAPQAACKRDPEAILKGQATNAAAASRLASSAAQAAAHAAAKATGGGGEGAGGEPGGGPAAGAMSLAAKLQTLRCAGGYRAGMRLHACACARGCVRQLERAPARMRGAAHSGAGPKTTTRPVAPLLPVAAELTGAEAACHVPLDVRRPPPPSRPCACTLVPPLASYPRLPARLPPWLTQPTNQQQPAASGPCGTRSLGRSAARGAAATEAGAAAVTVTAKGRAGRAWAAARARAPMTTTLTRPMTGLMMCCRGWSTRSGGPSRLRQSGRPRWVAGPHAPARERHQAVT